MTQAPGNWTTVGIPKEILLERERQRMKRLKDEMRWVITAKVRLQD